MKKYPIIHRLAATVALLTFAIAADCAETVAVTRVWPEKIVYRPGESAKIAVDLENKGKQALTASVSLAINHGLTDRDELPAQSASLPANGKATLTFAYPVPKERKWGHEALAVVKDSNGAVLAMGRDYFTVGDNPWELGHYVTIFGLRTRCPTMEDIANYVLNTRKGYYTIFEAYTPFPSYGDCMAPEAEVWRSAGDGYSKESKAHWRELVQQSHNQGMSVVTYIQNTSSGTVGCNFVRRHPDWFTYNKDGLLPVQIIEVDQLEACRDAPEDQPVEIRMGGYYHGTFGFLPSNAQLGDWWIDQLIKSIEMFGWDGFRSDGNPGIVEGYDYTGTFHKVPDLGAANAAFLKKVRQKVNERFPNFRFGWNNVAGGYPQMFCSPAEEDVMLPGAYSLYEFFNSAPQPSSVYHPWKKAAFYLQQEAAPIRERGGFPHAGWMPSNRYLEAVASACGQQIDTWAHPRKPGYDRFEFRWSEFLWDNQLRYVRPGDQAVKVEGPAQVWWQDFVHRRQLPGGRQRVIVHLLNMPANDDEGWADRPPAPAANVRVTFVAPPGRKLDKILAFSPDGAEDALDAKPDAKGTLTLPEVKLWTVVAAEFK